MEGNIPYRSLKCLKAHSISTTSQRLLKPIFRNRSQIKEEKNKRNIMNQNVIQYEYMLSQSYLKQNYINWATNLRAYNSVQMEQNLQSDTPSVFFKQTKLEQLRQQQKKKTQSNNLNVAEYSQYFGKKCTNISQNQLNFVNKLRKFQPKVKQMKGEYKILHAQMFNSYVHKQNNLPKLLKKSAIKKIKGINQKDFEIALDGRDKFPEFTYKNLRQKNYNLIQALSQGSKSNLSLPGIAWSVGLRSY